MRYRPTVLLLALSTVFAGCGGSGNGPSVPQTPQYEIDSSIPVVEAADASGNEVAFPSGISGTGAWYVVSTAGYYVNGSYAAYPVGQLNGTNITVVAAGGQYVWASFTATGGQQGLGILNLSNNQITQVLGVDSAAVSTDGSSAFVALEDSTGADTGAFETLTASGQATASTFNYPTTNGSFVPYARSTSGWTVGEEYAGASSSLARRALRFVKSRLGKHLPTRQSSGGPQPIGTLLISPTGTSTTLQGQSTWAYSVNDSGIAAGYDGSNAVAWSITGAEQNLGSGWVDTVLDNGVMVGASGSSNDQWAAEWQPDGSVTNLSAITEVLNGESYVEAVNLQGSGNFLGFGGDTSNNPCFFSIIPIPDAKAAKKSH